MINIQINYLWKIGRFINNYENKTSNVISLVSNYLSYYYGNSYKFSIYNINLMKKLYNFFPIYNSHIDNLDWSILKKILILSKKECYFYYRVVLLCHSDPIELDKLIGSNVYYRI